MSHALSPVSKDDVKEIVEAPPVELPSGGRVLLLTVLAVAVIVFVLGVNGPHAKAVWASFQVNFTYWFILAAAGTCFSAVFQICNAQWSRPIRRIFEASSSFLLYSLLPLAILYFGSSILFAWTHEAAPGKAGWLTPWFVYSRDLIGVFILAWLARRVVYYSIRRDIGAIRSGLTGASEEALKRWSAKSYDRYMHEWGENAQEEIQRAGRHMGRLSPIVIWAYALVTSLIAFDQIMSVDYHWFSTLFGVLYFMSGAYLAMAWVSIGIGLLRDMHPLFLKMIHRSTLWDTGKLLFGFGIFWAYMFWSHYLPIWYGNMPEETAWVILRLREMPWRPIAWLTFGACFVVPFLIGLSRDIKQVPILLFSLAAIVACGVWMQQYLLFVPTLFPKHIPLGISDIAITLGFMSAFLLSAASFLSKVPLIPFGDFYE